MQVYLSSQNEDKTVAEKRAEAKYWAIPEIFTNSEGKLNQLNISFVNVNPQAGRRNLDSNSLEPMWTKQNTLSQSKGI